MGEWWPSSPSRPSRPIGALTVALVLLSAACTGSDSTAAASLEAQLYPGVEQLQANFDLVEMSVQACMEAAGHTYLPMTLPAVAVVETRSVRLHTLDPARAATEGFGFADPVVGVEDPNATTGGLTPAERERWVDALFSCRSTADGEVNGAYEAAIEPLRVRYENLVASFEREPDVRELDAQWSACMRLAGFGQAETFRQFATGYLEARQAFNVGAPGRSVADQQAGLQRLLEGERVGAVAAASCADPIREDYARLWGSYLEPFIEELDVPTIPQ